MIMFYLAYLTGNSWLTLQLTVKTTEKHFHIINRALVTTIVGDITGIFLS